MLYSKALSRGDVALLAGWVAAILVVAVTLPIGRPVNDDYWALGSLMPQGFFTSLSWYFTEFQGNVASWFLILLHEYTWLDGVGPWGSLIAVGLTLSLVGGASWGALTLLGYRWPGGWQNGAVLTISSVVAWLSLPSAVSPNGMTLVFYIPSAIVHVWPWCCALMALGIALRGRGKALGCLSIGILGFLAGNLGLVEAAVISFSTVILGLMAWRRPAAWLLQPRLGWSWTVGLGLGLGMQLASPATWGRGAGLGSDGALETNVDAVNRILAQGDSLLGPSLSQSLLAVLDVESWARVLVPAAVAGDLLLRPGLLAVLILSSWWSSQRLEDFPLNHGILRSRLSGLTIISIAGFLAYSASGALYAYAGRHVAGLALVVTALITGLGLLGRRWWARHQRVLAVSATASVVVLAALALQQVRYGLMRAAAWDEALAVNKSLIAEGRLADLINVPLKAGLSQSGLRDHDGSGSYVEWVRRQK